MLRSRRWTDDEGGAALEFVTAGMILLLPLVYLVLAMAAIQAGALAVEGAARQAARVFVQSGALAEARASAHRAVEFTLADYGIGSGQAAVAITCSPSPSDCLSRRSLVTVSVSISVPLPLLPAALGSSGPLAVPLHATATQQVSRFWSSG